MKSSWFACRGVYFNIKYIVVLEIDLFGSFFNEQSFQGLDDKGNAKNSSFEDS